MFTRLAVLGAALLPFAIQEARAVELKDLENALVMELETGKVYIELYPDAAPAHVERLKTLAREDEYDDVVFHRVIPGFMAQTGDVEFGDMEEGFRPGRVGTGGSEYPDLPAEFSGRPFERGTVGMARSQNPDSANSQFFIAFDRADWLDGQYTVVGQVIEGMEHVDGITKGAEPSGKVDDPDRIVALDVAADL